MMRNRRQRRQKAILPLKVTISVGGIVQLVHTLDISASGVRLVVPTQFAPGTLVNLEFKRRRAAGTVIWSKPMKESKYDYETGIYLQNAGSSFWGIPLPLQEVDESDDDVTTIPFARLIARLSKEA